MRQLRCRILAGVVLSLATAASETRGAEESLLGSRVRVRTLELGEPQVGVLEDATPGELILRAKAAAPPMRVRRIDVTRLEVSRGSRRHPLKGLLVGAAAWGAIVGLVAAFDTLDESGVGEPLFVGGMLAAGAGIGSLVKTERWEQVPVGAASAGIGIAPRRLQARIVLKF